MMENIPDSPSANIDDGGCDRHCSNCNTTVTPLWRKFGPVKFLCNACGLYYKVNGDHRPYYMSKNKLNQSSKKLMLRCANCGTNKTTMWRKNGGTHVCNACGLYFRINGHNRPVTMRKDIIRTRRRRDTAYDMLDVGNSPLMTGNSNDTTASLHVSNASSAAATAAALLLKEIKCEPTEESTSSSSVASSSSLSSSSPSFDMKSVSCTSGHFSSFASHQQQHAPTSSQPPPTSSNTGVSHLSPHTPTLSPVSLHPSSHSYSMMLNSMGKESFSLPPDHTGSHMHSLSNGMSHHSSQMHSPVSSSLQSHHPLSHQLHHSPVNHSHVSHLSAHTSMSHHQLQPLDSPSQHLDHHSQSLYQLPNSCSRQSAMFSTNGLHHLDSNSVSGVVASSVPPVISSSLSGCSSTASTIDMSSSQLLNNSSSQFDNYYCHFF